MKAGLKRGDVILEIDSVRTKSLDLTEIANRIRGPIGSIVSLKIRRAGNTSVVNGSYRYF